MGLSRAVSAFQVISVAWCISCPIANASSRPNIVIVLIDDVGFADLRVNWDPHHDISDTPFLDAIAPAGIRLVDFHSGASVCTPSRAALLTGRLGKRTGVTQNFNPFSVAGLPTNETTLAETLKAAGYRTGMVGKWHLGITKDYHPNSRGFDFYYGLPYSNDMGCCDDPGYNLPPETPCPKDNYSKNLTDWGYPAVPLYNNRDIIEQPVNLTTLADRYAEMAAKFIKDESESKPFLLYAAFAHMHVPLSFMPHNQSGSSDREVYRNTLQEMDRTVEAISRAINESNQANNTIMWVAGDNGPWEVKCDLAGAPGPFVGYWQKMQGGGGSASKMTVWEAGHRVPGVIFWPGTVKPHGAKGSEAILSTLDIYPTVAALANISLPGDRIYDGVDITDLLHGKPLKNNRVLYHPNSGAVESPAGEFGAVRVGDFKAVYYTGGVQDCQGNVGNIDYHNPPLIFNVREDPMESKPLDPGSKDYPSIYTGIKKAMDDIRDSIAMDNTTVADYTEDKRVEPCCNPNHVRCRCNN